MHFLCLEKIHDKLAFCFERKELEKTIRRDLPAILTKAHSISTVSFKQYKPDDITLDWSSFPSEVHPAEVFLPIFA